VSARNFVVASVDAISETFTLDNFDTASGQPELVLREQLPDIYKGNLTEIAGYVSLDFGLNKKLSGNFGVRFESDKIDVTFDVGNYIQNGVARFGSTLKVYNELYPSLNLKYEINEKNFLRVASSLTQTLPEFKEIAPFEYVTPTGRIIKGNPELDKSDVFNIDVKWEFYPEKDELFSATTFYKKIKNPINLAQTRGSAGIFQFDNTGNEATIFGIELEGRINLIENAEEKSILSTNVNLTQMWFTQDLGELFQYKGLTESGLQGASDFIFNGSVSYNSRTKKEFIATVTGNYSSDKIYALGSPEDFANSATLFNDEILEKGFVTLDVVMSKMLSDSFSIRLVGKNLLNPDIQQTQQVTVFDVNENIVSSVAEVVQSYKKGSQISLGLSYKF
jgi:outer membrane receptor protein involved in Fe transport